MSVHLLAPQFASSPSCSETYLFFSANMSMGGIYTMTCTTTVNVLYEVATLSSIQHRVVFNILLYFSPLTQHIGPYRSSIQQDKSAQSQRTALFQLVNPSILGIRVISLPTLSSALCIEEHPKICNTFLQYNIMCDLY